LDRRRPSNDYQCEKNNFQFGYAVEKCGMGSIAKYEMETINETFDDIIKSVGYFTNSAMRILKSKTPEDVWEGCIFKRDI